MSGPRAIRAAIGASAAALVLSAGVTQLYQGHGGNPIKSHPEPPLYSNSQISGIAGELAAQKTRADAAFSSWARTHPGRDDAAFTAYALSVLGPPPGQAEQARELAGLHSIAATRTSEGMTAATWLEVYGKSDVWKLYLHDTTEADPPAVRARAKAALKADTAMAKSLAATAEAHFARTAPSVVDPTLRKVPVAPTKFTYPSKHAVYVCSEQTVLSALDPGRAADFSAMAAQVAYSRLYSAGHYPSDLVAGAFLGYLIGDYETSVLRTSASRS